MGTGKPAPRCQFVIFQTNQQKKTLLFGGGRGMNVFERPFLKSGLPQSHLYEVTYSNEAFWEDLTGFILVEIYANICFGMKLTPSMRHGQKLRPDEMAE